MEEEAERMQCLKGEEGCREMPSSAHDLASVLPRLPAAGVSCTRSNHHILAQMGGGDLQASCLTEALLAVDS